MAVSARYRIPKVILTDQGTNFTAQQLKKLYNYCCAKIALPPKQEVIIHAQNCAIEG